MKKKNIVGYFYDKNDVVVKPKSNDVKRKPWEYPKIPLEKERKTIPYFNN